MLRRLTTLLAMTAAATALTLGFAGTAQAVTPEQKLAVLSSWTQTSVTSYNAWNSARTNQGAWAEYAFDWSTDLCSTSPDNPLGFNFELSCWHHDFGYRNWKAVGQFAANKSRLDDMFYADLKRKCATYNVFVRPACYSLAWTYYQAVRIFGNAYVTAAEMAKAQTLYDEGLARMDAQAR